MSRSGFWGVEIDPETNLPVVPEGYYWKVTSGRGDGIYRTVKLRRRGKVFAVTTHPASRTGSEEEQWDDIKSSAEYIVWRLWKHERPKHVEPRVFAGTYPPKRAPK